MHYVPNPTLQFLLANAELRKYVSIPKIVFVGMQTSGKSSLIEALVRLPFNFTGTGIATRVPLEISTISSLKAPVEPVWNLTWAPPAPLKFRRLVNISTSDIREELNDLHSELIAQELVCPIPVELQLHWRGAPNITFIDLPGFKGNARDQKEKDIQLKIYAMNKNIILKQRNETFVIVEPASSDASNYFAHQIFKDIVENDQLGKSAILACSKFDLVKDVPDLHEYLSDYGAYIKHAFVLSCPHGESRSQSWETRLQECNDFDIAHSANGKGVWTSTDFGVNKFATHLEKVLETRMIEALPRIKQDLTEKLMENAALRATYESEETKSIQTWIRTHLNAHVIEFTVSMIDSWDAKYLAVLPMRTRDDELALFQKRWKSQSNQNLQFDYRVSPIWTNPDYQPKTKHILLCDCPLAGSAQIRRVLREFEVSLFTRVMTLDDNFKLLLQNKVLSMRSADGSCSAWNEVIVEIVRDMASDLLFNDIEFLCKNVHVILEDWGAAIIATKSEIPLMVRPEMLSALSEALEIFLSCSSMQMHKFVESAITSVTYRAVPKAGFTISEMHELCSSLYVSEPSNEINMQLGSIGVTVTDIQVGKAKRMCMERLNLGITVISQALGAIFDLFFTTQFRKSLTQEMVKWEHKFTAASTVDFYKKEIDFLENQHKIISSWLQELK